MINPDPRKVLFSKTIDRGRDSVAIAVECEEEISVSLSIPHTVITYESMSAGVPVIVATFSDAAGDLVNVKNLDTTLIYRLSIGTSQEVIVSDVPILISHIEFGNIKTGESQNVSFEVHFVHAAWKDFSYTTRNRGWSESRYSDVVRDLLEGFNSQQVEETSGVNDFLVQPHWSNNDMLRWVAPKAEGGSGNFVYGITLNGDAFFRQFSSLTDVIRDDFGANNEIIHFRVIENTHKLYKQGGSGIVYHYYDYSSGNYTNETIPPQSTAGISDWSSVDGSYPPYLHIYGEREDSTRAEAVNRVKSINDSFLKVKVMTHAPSSLLIRVGECVDITIRSFGETVTNSSFSEHYSGKYVVSESKIVFKDDKKSSLMHVEMTLVRPGVNDGDKRNYVRA